MFLPDNPIQNKKQDKLGRSHLSKKIAEMILRYEGKESFVIGIEGSWGSGKTSLVNLILNELEGKIEPVVFNPWFFENQKALLANFFSRMAVAVKNRLGEDFGKKVVKYTKKISSADLGISVGAVSINPFRLFKLFFPDKTLSDLRHDLNKNLRSIDKKIVVVIDDIDRLDDKETILIFKTVKLTADFPNTIFLLPYDRKNVEKRINSPERGIVGSEYLKKIVQVSFTLPNPDKQQLHQIFFHELDKTIESIYGKTELVGENEKRWNSLFHKGFGSLFENIRDINRFISSLRLDWSIVEKDDVNTVDFIGIGAVRVFAPRLYNAIINNQELFLGSMFSITSRIYDDSKAREDEYRELLTKEVDDHLKDAIDGIVKELFPVMASNTSYDSGTKDEWKKQKRICSVDNFGFYSQLGVPYGDISGTEVSESLSLLENSEKFSDKIKSLHQEKRLRKFLDRLLYKFEALSNEQLSKLILFLWSLEDQIDDNRQSVFDLDDFETKVSRITIHGIKDMIPENERVDFIKNLLQETISFYFPVHFIAYQESYFDEASYRSYGGPLINKDEVEQLKPLALEKIKILRDKNKLQDNKNLPFLLFRLRKWDSEETVKSFISKLIENPEGVIKLLKAFTSNIFSSAGNYRQIDKDSLSKLFEIQKIDEKVKALSNDFLKNVSPEEKEAVDLYNNPPRK